VIRTHQLRGRLDAGGPIQQQAEGVSRRHLGRYWSLSFAAAQIADLARPGQFVEVAVGAPDTLLRRPFSIAGVSRHGMGAGTVEIVFDVHGPGTRWMTELDVHDVVDLIGPLGTWFPLPQRRVACLLVGGGYGTAPLFYLGEQLVRQGLRVDMIVGAATKDRILSTIEAKRLSASVTFTTDDGSYGVQGQVTDVLDDVVSSARTGVVYACGPNPMLRAVSQRCVELELPVQVAVEERMACGVGVCFTCVLPTHGTDGTVSNQRACIEGPVFNGARVAWEVSRYGTDPSATVGAEAPAAEVVATPAEAVAGMADVGVGRGGPPDPPALSDRPDRAAREAELWGER
jgi:dihydroorotate dehydrogenase electron transfer subunit